MNNLSILKNEVLTMSSREIAELTGKEHKNVKRDIDVMCSQLKLDALKFELIYFDSMNRQKTEYHLNKELTLCLVSGYNAHLRMAIIKRWQELESQQEPRLPQTFAEALQLAADQAKQLELQAPKVAFVDNYVESSGGKTFREVAKLLKANERQFRSFMVANKIQYVLNGSWAAYQNHIDAGRFTHKTGEKNGHAYTECRFTPKGIQWISGFWERYKEMHKAKLDNPL